MKHEWFKIAAVIVVTVISSIAANAFFLGTQSKQTEINTDDIVVIKKDVRDLQEILRVHEIAQARTEEQYKVIIVRLDEMTTILRKHNRP